MTADLQRQIASWLALVKCMLKILALLKPLVDVVNHLPSPLLSSVQEFNKAAVELAPCFSMGNGGGHPAGGDLLCLSCGPWKCLRD